ncbi:hypothetical protein A9798_01105 [Edwardsiella hoshinae]|uniref:Cell division protein DamX n=1 Tax=Edwardsiella hoshinae TaxID=93378 RepID=A0A376D5U4_9GAMM|nr:SPOR domain-containing protein [Edwardsiella hoshinae]AOV95682.1 hypothetical protein A9798_01105 [Edwardsiella hoshinae]QPR28470.1 SPOR domain-containing protein [Edwardsiella hoshinae]STC83159.1 Uncharacterized protein conserved in bacteria [Edwardsiella hoshinae]
MDQEEFKADDELKPDASDRRSPRARNRRSAPRLAVSRQHLMIGAGVLVLLVVIVAIGSALKSPTKGSAESAGTTSGAREINLADTSSPTNSTASSTNLTDMQDGSGVSNSALPGQPQPIAMPPVSATPTQSAPAAPERGQQRIDLAGNSISDALTQQQGALDSLSQIGTLPTGPATLASGAVRQPKAAESALRPLPSKTPPRREEKAPIRHSEKRTPEASAPKQTAHLPVVGSNGKQAAHLPTAAGSSAGSSLKSAPGSHYTLQLSGASQPNTLNAFARRQNLSHYWVYETSRNGKPWYVLVSGSYATPSDARRAIASLPAEVQAMKPWARPLSQVQKDAK